MFRCSVTASLSSWVVSPPAFSFSPRGFHSLSGLQIHLGHLRIENPFYTYTTFMVMRRKRRRGCCMRGEAAPASRTSLRVRKRCCGMFFLCCSQWLEPSSLCRPLKGWQTKWMTYSCIAYRREKHPARLGWCTGCTTRRLFSHQTRDAPLKGMREKISVEFFEDELLIISCCPPKDCRSFSLIWSRLL